jgi:hypothetical protein
MLLLLQLSAAFTSAHRILELIKLAHLHILAPGIKPAAAKERRQARRQ